MILPLQNFTTLVQNMAAGVQGSAAQLIDLSIGSVLRALIEACASVALWMQWLILQVLSMTRAATSSGADLDSWMADFSLTRLAGSQAVGQVTFARYTVSSNAVLIPTGATVSTNDGTLSFAVVAQTSNPAWNGSTGFVLAAMAASVTVPVQTTTPGLAGNVLPGAIGLLTTAIAGIDTVSNALIFSGGVNAESDAALRSRFQLYINSRSLATAGAVEFAIASLQQGLRYAVLENVDTLGNALPGNFCVVVDDGTGAPPNTLLASASAAVEAVRPIGSTYSVQGPAIIGISVAMSAAISNAQNAAQIALSIQQSVLAWIASLPIGGTLAVSKIEALAHGTDPSVVSVTGTTINNATLDVTAPDNGVLLPIAVMVN
jgi:uncharacterized phage protein gp47/JayE